VFSVGGSLATYEVRKESEEEYQASLKTQGGKREDIPPEIKLWKEGEIWQAQPWHEEVVSSLLQVINVSSRKAG
jgi:hypothetical protein